VEFQSNVQYRSHVWALTIGGGTVGGGAWA